MRQKRKKIEEAIKQIETKTGRNASDEEIAQELGIGEEELNDWQTQLNVTNVISLNEFVEQGGEPVMDAKNNSHFIQPEESVQEEELKKVLMESLELLTEKEKKVILLYYYEDLTLKRNQQHTGSFGIKGFTASYKSVVKNAQKDGKLYGNTD